MQICFRTLGTGAKGRYLEGEGARLRGGSDGRGTRRFCLEAVLTSSVWLSPSDPLRLLSLQSADFPCANSIAVGAAMWEELCSTEGSG